MKKIFVFISIFLFILILGGIFFNPGEELFDSSANKAEEILIRLKTSPKIYKIKVGNFSLDKLIKFLSLREEIDLVEPNYSFKISDFTPNDSDYDKRMLLAAAKKK